MIGDSTDPHRQQDLYWNELVELKVAVSYIQRYRDHLSRWVTFIGAIRAIASSVSIAAWAIWKQYAFLWGLIIAVAQVADALREVFPFTKAHKAASEHAVALNALFIDAQLEWEGVLTGSYADDQIMKRLHKLRKLRHDADSHSFPQGLKSNKSLFAKAEEDAKRYVAITYKQ
jgi:hypothetical protein